MASNLASYYKEEEGFDCLENEHGFCAYRIDKNTGNCYIGHVFISERSRKKGKAIEFLNKIESICKDNGIKIMVGDLFMNKYNSNGYTKKIMVMLFNGFKIIDVNTGCVTIMKEI